jgi:uncharacterized repeat protein (TIGR03803 family)
MRRFPGSSFLCPLVGAIALACATTAVADTETVIHDFVQFGEGLTPQGNLIADADGNVYGVTSQGGAHSNGTVFKMRRRSNGQWEHDVLYDFGAYVIDATSPSCLVFGPDESLYGCAVSGGIYGYGAVFRLSPGANGTWSETVLYSFGGVTNDGTRPASLTFDAAGNLIGAAANSGGGLSVGTIFELAPASGQWTETTIHTFADNDGAYPTTVVIGQSGTIYGVTQSGGVSCPADSYGCGVVFELTRQTDGTWRERVLHAFTDHGDSAIPRNLVIDQDERLYGATQGTVFRMVPESAKWKFETLYTFTGGSDGFLPISVSLDQSGNVYGAALEGGVSSCNYPYGCGTIFQLAKTAAGLTFSVVYSFQSPADGSGPQGVIPEANGTLLGVTSSGGDSAWPGGSGTVFELTPNTGSWAHTIITNFPNGDGTGPQGGLLADAAGNLYGTTTTGGRLGLGMVFQLSRSHGGGWKETILHAFGAPGDGSSPQGNLTFDAAGNLYGATVGGGVYSRGTVFKLTRRDGLGGWTETILHHFGGPTTFGNSLKDAAYPVGPVVVDAVGNVYGTAALGGHNGSGCWSGVYHIGCGTVFKLSQQSNGRWKETFLHSFDDGADGAVPETGLIADTAGNLYGTTFEGGSGSCENNDGTYGCGTIFMMSPSSGSWSFSTLYSFPLTGDGEYPSSGLTFGSDGSLYGETWEGVLCCGTVYRLSPGAQNTWSLTTIYAFNMGQTQNDGVAPAGGLAFDAQGNLYGTTMNGGGNSCTQFTDCGTVFKLSPNADGSWSESIIHSFVGPTTDGFDPMAGVLVGPLGHLYGTTAYGGFAVNGSNGPRGGTVFEIVP